MNMEDSLPLERRLFEDEEENPSPSMSLSSSQASSPPHSANEKCSSSNKRTSPTCIGSVSHSNDVCQSKIQKAYEEAGIDVSEDELIGIGMLVDSIDLFGDTKTEVGGGELETKGQLKQEDSNVEENELVTEEVEVKEDNDNDNDKGKEVCGKPQQKDDIATGVIQYNDNDKGIGINIRNHRGTFRPKEPEPEPAPISTIYTEKNSSMTSQSPCSVLTNPTCLLERQGDDASLATARSERVKLIKSRLRSLEGNRSRSYTSVRGRHISQRQSQSHKSPVGTVVSLLPTTSSSVAEWSSPSAKAKHRPLPDNEGLCVADTDCCTSITSHSSTTTPVSATSSGLVATRIPSATEQTLRIAREAMMFVLLIVLASIAYLIYRDDQLHQLELQSKQLQVMEQMLLMKQKPELDRDIQRQITDGDGYGHEPLAIGSKTLPTPTGLRISHQRYPSAEEKGKLIQASFEQYMTGVTFDNVGADPSPFTSKISSTKKHPSKFKYLQSSSFLRDVLEEGGNYQLYNHVEPKQMMTVLDDTSVHADSQTGFRQEQNLSTDSVTLTEPSFLESDGLENTPTLTILEDDDVENIITRNHGSVHTTKKETFVVMGVVINY